MSIDRLFFELLQVAIGSRKELTAMPTSREWALLFEMSKKQALVGIAFAGLNRLKCDGGFGSNIGLDEMTYLRWLGMAAKIQQRNRIATETCRKVVVQYAHDGLQCCVLKGQGNLVNYPDDLRDARTPGDVDVWCRCADPNGAEIAVSDLDGKGAHYETYSGKRAVIEYALMQARVEGIDKPSVRYNNTELHNADDVEIHHRPSMMNNPVHNHRLQRWCEENADSCFCGDSYEGIPIPTVSFNAVYQLSHIYTHLFDEGVGLRQLLDYYFVLRALHIEQGSLADRTQNMSQWAEGMGIVVKSNEEIMHTLSRFGMKKFAGAVMYVLQTVFAMPGEYLICKPNEKEGKFLLDEIMQAGNFGKYDDRIKHDGSQFSHAIEKTKHNLRLLTHYPEEVICEPFFRVYHWVWRRFELWRY